LAELLQVTAPSGVVFLTSPAITELGYIHGFSTRIGGVSPAPFNALNLGNAASALQDSADHISENRQRFQYALGAENHRLYTVSQVHGASVAMIGSSLGPQVVYRRAPPAARDTCHADALIVKMPKYLAGMQTADCVPILIARTDGRLAAVVHAGWRGLAAGVIGNCIAALKTIGGDQVFRAAIGPCIGANRYEVGPEVALAFEKADLRAAIAYGDKPHVDLALAAQIELGHGGVTQIDSAHLCTYDRADWFYSHRRDRGVTGRMLSVIGLPL